MILYRQLSVQLKDYSDNAMNSSQSWSLCFLLRHIVHLFNTKVISSNNPGEHFQHNLELHSTLLTAEMWIILQNRFEKY